MAVPTILTPGAKVGGKYEVVDVIGFGGMGVVYKVREQVGAVSRIRALKTVLPQYASDPAVVTRFRQEAEKMCMLEHENIVPVLSYSEEGEFPYLVMPFIEGQTLKEYLASHITEHGRGLSLAETMEIGLEVVRGLEVAHRFVQPDTQRTQPMIHRDIKPGNIMVRVENQGGERRHKVLIMDFGIAKVLSAEDSGHTLTEVIGTVRYASPEQIRRGKDLDPRADIYSLGMVLYELHCGKHVFAGLPEHTVLMRMMQMDLKDHEISFPDDAPERFRQLIARSIAVDPDRRFPNVGEMRSAMRRILDEDSERATSDATRGADFARAERKRAVEQGGEQFAAETFAKADARLAEGEAALSDRRFPQAVSMMRAAAELFARAADDAGEGHERARLVEARAGLSALQASAVAAKAGDLAKDEVAAATKAAELFEKALAGGDLTGAGRALVQAERAWREAAERATREQSRRDAAAACAELEKAIAAGRAEIQRIPAELRELAGSGELALVEAHAKAARASIEAGDFAAATTAAREGHTTLAEIHDRAEKALAEALDERERRLAAELAAIESDKDVELAAATHAKVVAMAAAAREHFERQQHTDAVGVMDRALKVVAGLRQEIATARTERDRRLEAAERNRRAEPAAREWLDHLQRARERLASLGAQRGAEATQVTTQTREAEQAERDAAAGEYAAAAPALRAAAERLDALCEAIAARQENERRAAALGPLRSAATQRSQELAALGSAVAASPEARRLLAVVASAEEHSNAGDLAAAIRILEESLPALDQLLTAKRAQIEHASQETEAQRELARATRARDDARALGERATANPAFATAAAELDEASRALARADFTAAVRNAAAAERGFAELVVEVRRAERAERLLELRERRHAIDDRIAALPPVKPVGRAGKALGKSIAKLEKALAAEDEAEAGRLASEIERWVQTLAAGGSTQEFDRGASALPWRIGVISGGVAAAFAAILWFVLGRSPKPPIQVAVQPTIIPRPADTPIASATVEPSPRPTRAAPTAEPTSQPRPTPPQPTAAVATPVPLEPSPQPLALARARPEAKSVTIRPGGQARFDASLKDARDAVLEWRLGGDAVAQGETFVLGKELSETPGKKKVELVASRGREHATLRTWDLEIEAPPLGFGRLDPPTTSLERSAGARVSFRAPVKTAETDNLSFQWQVNGQTARGIEGPSYDFEPERPGEYLVAVRATAPWGASIANTWKLSVRPLPTPSIEEPKRPQTGDPTAEAQGWIQAYCDAFQTKDTDALIALGHLTSQAEASRLREALSAMRELRVSCSNASVKVNGDQAVVSFDRTDHWRDPRGSEMERALPRITKTLRRNNGRWVAVQ